MTSKTNIPYPQGKYLPAKRFENIIFTSGMTPRLNGELIKTGKVLSTDPLTNYKTVSKQVVDNALNAAKNELKKTEKLDQVLSLNVYINAESSFTSHSKLANDVSSYLIERMGIDKGIGSRTAVGVSSLPGNAPIEINIIVSVRKK